MRRCLARGDRQASFFEHRSHRIVYRRYASLFFLAGVDEDEVRGAGDFASGLGGPRRRLAARPRSLARLRILGRGPIRRKSERPRAGRAGLGGAGSKLSHPSLSQILT